MDRRIGLRSRIAVWIGFDLSVVRLPIPTILRAPSGCGLSIIVRNPLCLGPVKILLRNKLHSKYSLRKRAGGNPLTSYRDPTSLAVIESCSVGFSQSSNAFPLASAERSQKRGCEILWDQFGIPHIYGPSSGLVALRRPELATLQDCRGGLGWQDEQRIGNVGHRDVSVQVASWRYHVPDPVSTIVKRAIANR